MSFNANIIYLDYFICVFMQNNENLTPNLNSELATNGVPKYITKKLEYRLLLRLIKRHKLAFSKGRGFNIQAVVNTLSIDPKTARKWLNTPRVQQALIDEMDFFVQKMQETGAKDWRQWAKQIEMVQGISQKNNQEINLQNNVVIVKDKEKGIFKVEGV
jgi:hypothetical protein